MRVNQIVEKLNSIFYDYMSFENAIRHKYDLCEKDIRFSYYRLSNHTVDATIHLLIISDICLQDRNFLKNSYIAYSIPDRFSTYNKSLKPAEEILFFITGELIIMAILALCIICLKMHLDYYVNNII